MLTRYGTSNIIFLLVFSLVIYIISTFIGIEIIKYILITLSTLLCLFTFWFFRDPSRIIPNEAIEDESILISPADGKIVAIENEFEKHYLKDDSIRISIFLSPLDVHVNRSPVSGEVKFYEYFQGDYLVAFHPKSSELNEHSRIGVENKYGKVFFKQIVGFLARRIVCELKVGDKLSSGDKFGMMKFGSRMDVAVSPNSEILVKLGDKVVAGQTIIAKLR